MRTWRLSVNTCLQFGRETLDRIVLFAFRKSLNIKVKIFAQYLFVYSV
jgi:hypothetical protein